MRDQHIAAIERKIERIQFLKSIGKVIYSLIILTVLILIFINLSTVLALQVETVHKIDGLSIEITETEQVFEEVDKVSLIEEKEPLTSEERELVCRIVSAEARGEDLQGQMAVAQVIKDRSELWGMTPTEVVTAPYQFTKPYKGEISDKTYLAVANVFDGNMRVFEELTTHFASNEPYWAENKVTRGKIGVHKFYY